MTQVDIYSKQKEEIGTHLLIIAVNYSDSEFVHILYIYYHIF